MGPPTKHQHRKSPPSVELTHCVVGGELRPRHRLWLPQGHAVLGESQALRSPTAIMPHTTAQSRNHLHGLQMALHFPGSAWVSEGRNHDPGRCRNLTCPRRCGPRSYDCLLDLPGGRLGGEVELSLMDMVLGPRGSSGGPAADGGAGAPVCAPRHCSSFSSMSQMDGWGEGVTSSECECSGAQGLSRAELDFWKFLTTSGPGGRGKLPRVGSHGVNLFSPGAVLCPEGQEHACPSEAALCPGENSSPADRKPEAEEKQCLVRECSTWGPVWSFLCESRPRTPP